MRSRINVTKHVLVQPVSSGHSSFLGGGKLPNNDRTTFLEYLLVAIANGHERHPFYCV